ncbi:MAG TPA: hypothetical protein VHE35_24195 [Kofleriaceae bacterium]|nr:hypothetical protein [Kofleriaceae bacterium]
MTRRVALALAALTWSGCGAGGAGDDDGPADAALADAPVVDSAPADALVDAPPCSATPEAPPLGAFFDTAQLAIAADGTIYRSPEQPFGEVDRWTPGHGDPEPYVTLLGGPRINGMAIDPLSGHLFVASETGLWELDPTVSPPAPVKRVADRTRAIAAGPDGAIYFTSLQGGTDDIRRMTATTEPTVVAAPLYAEPWDLLVDGPDALIITDLATTRAYRITLDPQTHTQRDRVMILDNGEKPYALARDAAAHYYYVSFTGELRRYELGVGFGNATELRLGDASVKSALDLAFARGPLGCTDLFAATPMELTQLTVGTTGTP